MITLTQTQYQPLQVAQYENLTSALDDTSMERSGLNFHSARGELIEALEYSQLAVEARLTGARLLAQGLVKGDRVGLVAETESDFVRAFMGCLYARLVPCPLPLPVAFGAQGAYTEQLRRILKVAEASAVIVPTEYHARLAENLEGHDLRFFGPLSDLGTEEVPLPEGDPDPNELAYLQFSSGTTKAPKGVAISHRAMMANVEGMAIHALQLTSKDRGMSWLPFYHDMGLVGCMILPIATHMSMDYLATRDFIRRPGLWLTMIERAGVTLSYAPSFGYQLAARRKPKKEDLDLTSWRIAGIGGDMIKPENLSGFASVYKPYGFRESNFLPSYGMAEASLGVTFERPGRGCHVQHLNAAELERGKAVVETGERGNTRGFALCGSVLPGHNLEVRDADDNVIAEQEVGTVFVRGPSIMLGYFDDAGETSRMLDADGWLNTGDLGYLTDGNLVLTGRAKDLIIINGRNIWPQDIEWSVEQFVEGVREGRVAAFGGDGASTKGEENVVVVAECRLTKPEEREAFRKQIDAQVRGVFGVVPEVSLSRPGALPRTSSGKLSRSKTHEMFLAGAFNT